MTTVNEIIQISITRGTRAVERAAFNIPLILTTHHQFADRYHVYTSLASVEDDFSTTSNTYKMAQKAFGQTRKPPSVVVGRRQVDEVAVSFTVANLATYELNIQKAGGDLETYTFTSDSSALATEIAAGLKSAYDLNAISGITVTDNLDGSLTVEVSTPGTGFSLTGTSNVIFTPVAPTETYVEALEAVQEFNDTFYAVTCEDHTDAVILALAAAVEAKKKVFITSSSASAIKTSSTTDIASQLDAAGYNRTMLIYSASADTQFPECAFAGGQVVKQPGSYTGKFKPLVGVTYDYLTPTESGYIKAKNANSYERVGGVDMLSEGVVSSGEFFDNIQGSDWFESRLSERIFFRLVNTEKLAYTRKGVAVIESEIRAVVQEGIQNGLFTDTPRAIVNMPDPVTIDPNLRAQRRYEGISVQVRFAGGIHFVGIEAFIEV